MNSRPPGPTPEADAGWHARPVETLVAALETGAAGLSQAEADRRLARHGPNRLPEAPREGPVRRFLRQFANLLIQVLLVAALVTAALGHYVDAGVILAVVLVNAVVGFLQEGKAEAALAAIRDMLSPRAAVLRGGRREDVPGEAVVPGDVVLLEAGDRVPADLRLIEVRGLRVEEAALTGESVAVEKATPPVAPDAPLGDRRSMAWSGTLVVSGAARGVAVATGPATEIGRIGRMVAGAERVETPLLRKMAGFAKGLTVVILAAAAAILGFGLGFGGMGFRDLFMAVVGLSVAAIPEGLPAILTVTLAIGVQGMARRRAIVRRLPAIEALGAVGVICSDKTGTLTRNEMTVTAAAVAGGRLSVSGGGWAPHGAVLREGAELGAEADPDLAEFAACALLCNDAEIVREGEDWAPRGDPMEAALVAFAMKAGLDPAAARAAEPRTDAIPFDAEHRFMAVLTHDHAGHGRILVKGAPERVLEMCAAARGPAGGDAPLDAAAVHAEVEALAAEGLRVIALAAAPADAEKRALAFEDVARLTFLGLVGLMDPPREAAIEAVAECRAAGIRVKMITGDHARTASAVAALLGLERPEAVLTGADLDGLSDDALRARVAETDVFARTSPEHKLRLVRALQAEGAVVAMTGDGVNDAPALKAADVGVAMGGKGSEAAKEAAEIVLADDDFATLAAAVRAGRTVYDNLRKAIAFLLPVNGGESVSLVLAILIGATLPITPVQILWVNMVSSVLLAMALAFEPAEPGVMRRPPRPPKAPVLSRFVIWRVLLVSALFSAGIFGSFEWGLLSGLGVEASRTLAVNTLVAMEIFYLFSVRRLSAPSLTRRAALGTRAVLLAVAGVVALQALFTYAPFMEAFFETRALGPAELAVSAGAGVALLLVLEIDKRAALAWRAIRRART